MARIYKYRIQSAPAARNDGSGHIDFDVYAIYSEDGTAWDYVPGFHKTISVPTSQLKTCNDMAPGAARNRATIAAIKNNVGTMPQPPARVWTDAALEAFMAINDATSLEADRLNEYVTVTLKQQFPIDIAS